jgi:hypothetical protein
MSEATEVMQARIDYLSGCVEDLKKAIRTRDHQLNRLRKILIRINAINDDPGHYNEEIDALTLEFTKRVTAKPDAESK